MTWIDLQSRKKVLDFRPSSGTIRGVQALGNGDIVVSMTSKSLLVWDATIGKQVAAIEGLGEPSFVLEHSIKAQSPEEVSLLNPETRWWSLHSIFSPCLLRDR